MARSASTDFAAQARAILDLPIADRVNALGGYGPGGEVIYEAHPAGCPSVLVDSRPNASATFMSNGSVGFSVKLAEGMDIVVLDANWDMSEKREIGVPSQNVWLDVRDGTSRRIASLMNPNANLDSPAAGIRIVKLGDPNRSMWYCARFAPSKSLRYETAVRFSFATTPAGPAVLRETFVRNTGRAGLNATLWTLFRVQSTQRFVYNKGLWYDAGLPLDGRETIMAAPVPYTDIVQIKRVSNAAAGARFVDATCDYLTFIGDTADSASLPAAVRAGRMLPGGAGRKLNRFSSPTLAASQFALKLAPGREACVQQRLLYVLDPALVSQFQADSGSPDPDYRRVSAAFRFAGRRVVKATGPAFAAKPARATAVADPADPNFQVELPADPKIAAYANSVWIGVAELYENCRAHGAKLANGIELGTRDRAQDMWPKMKEDPGRVRADLVHAMSMMYQSLDAAPVCDHRLTLREKLHGMFPRQYPSRWDDRRAEIFNDNRPYNDSATWFVNAINMYVRETGDVSLLGERVRSVRLTSPDTPEKSGLVGCERSFTVAEVMVEVLECLARHAADSPYGLIQVLYGDWCDPLDMFGTGTVGDPTTRGHGRGAGLRLTGHVFTTAVETIDLFGSPRVTAAAGVTPELCARVDKLKRFASDLRQAMVRVAWEDGKNAGFVAMIHERRKDGSTPDYAAGELGYTLGSMRGRDFDGASRRDLVTQAAALAAMTTDRDYLAPVAGRDAIVAALLKTVNELFYRPKLGLVLFTVPIANNKLARDLVGRMGVIPAGTAENGEYHHAQAMMHCVRLGVPGQPDTCWRQFKPIMTVTRDPSVAGPFETPCTSYASDPADPHFGRGMYFGLSGQVDWIVEIYHRLAGVALNLHDPRRPAVVVNPTLPAELNDAFTFRRIIHVAQPPSAVVFDVAQPPSAVGGTPGAGAEDGPAHYRRVALTVTVRREGRGKRLVETRTLLNGRPVDRTEVADLAGLDRVEFEIVRVYGK